MGQIYSEAKTVRIWVGEADPGICVALKVLDELGQQFLNLLDEADRIQRADAVSESMWAKANPSRGPTSRSRPVHLFNSLATVPLVCEGMDIARGGSC